MSTILYLFILLIISHVPQSFSQSGDQQNIQTHYPFSPPQPPLPVLPSPPPPGGDPPPTTIIPPPQQPSQPRQSSTRSAVGKAIGATAASTLVLSGLIFFLLLRRSRRKREREAAVVAVGAAATNGGNNPNPQNDNFTRFNGNLKGVIVDENGLDVLYWRNLEDGDNRSSFKKNSYKNLKDEQKEEEKRIVSERSRKYKPPPVQESPLLRGKSSTSESRIWAEEKEFEVINKAPSFSNGVSLKVEKRQDSVRNATPPLPPPPGAAAAPLPPPPGAAAPPPSLPPQVVAVGAVPKGKTAAPPPPPPPVPLNKGPAPPPPPPPATTTNALATSMRPPPPPGKRSSSAGESTSSNSKGQVPLKPLHWDKVNPNAGHSMVWDKLDKGSFKFDGDLMEALFGYVATNRKSPQRDARSSTTIEKSGPPSPIFILDTRKSQNTAIVLKSLGISRGEIIDALLEGRGLNPDALEKLTKIAPTEEEASQITAFNGDPTRLADAESFLYHLLRAVPTAFDRFNSMLFRSNFDSEISHVKESLKSLESACNELRTRGLFLKLLEAVLKAGNRLNAGTARGNAQAFNLTALRKLSDVKSSDGKTTLLQFVVQEVVRAEGKRCVLNRSRSLSGSSNAGGGQSSSDKSLSRDEREREYMMLGLPVIGGLSNEFSNVKKAATLDYDLLSKAIAGLESQLVETRKIVARIGDDGGGFARVMVGFLDTAELEMRVVKEEEVRVMETVKKTTDYYQAGSMREKAGSNALQLFVIVRDFLGMVDQVCIDIARNVQKRKPPPPSSPSPSAVGSSSPETPRVFRFPKLPANFMSDNSKSSSSDDSDDEESEVR